MRSTYFRQDLPHVVGSPNLRVLCLVRPGGAPLPYDHRLLSQLRTSPLSQWSYTIIEYLRKTVSTLLRLFSISISSNSIPPGIEWVSQVFDTSLCTQNTSWGRLYMPQPFDSGGPPHPYQVGCFCVDFGGQALRFNCFVGDLFSPPQAQHPIRVVGYTLPDRYSHPAKSIKTKLDALTLAWLNRIHSWDHARRLKFSHHSRNY